jgi:hypothetical protein
MEGSFEGYTFEDPSRSLPEEIALRIDADGIEVLEIGSQKSYKVDPFIILVAP